MILAAVMVFFSAVSFAQQRPYDRAAENNLWLLGDNIAGLRQDKSSNISYAELYGGTEAGGFRATNDAPSLWRAGAEARTIKHVDRFSMIGGFSFEQASGRDMCGSMFIQPGFYPLDVLEFTPGRKSLQTYAFDGGVSVDLADGWRLGARMDFKSANYSKRKDLRHTNYRLDMKVAPGLTYTSGNLTFGLNYIFAKNSEYTDAEQIGTGESSYYAFLDKGLMFGKYEVWTGSGVHLDEDGVRGLPLREIFNGVGVQFSSSDRFYIDFEYLRGAGSAGEKQIFWYRFPSDEFSLGIGENFSSGGTVYHLSEKFSVRRQKNYETVLEKVTENGVTIPVEYGQNRIFARQITEGDIKLRVLRPGFEFFFEYLGKSTEAMASQVYPYVTDCTLNVSRFDFGQTFHAGKWDIELTEAIGFGSRVENGRLVDESHSTVSVPYRLEDWYMKSVEFETAFRIAGGLSVRRNFVHGIYLQAEASAVKAFGIELLDGNVRGSADLRLGWTF